MKAREERQKVMLKARMRAGSAWHDVCILNLSAHGVGLQAADPPPRGTYVEIRRGSNTIVARVAWTRGHRAGLRSQDVLFIPALVRDAASPLAGSEKAEGSRLERRRVPRTAQAHAQSRLAGRAMEFACLAFLGLVMAGTLFGAVRDSLARPMAEVTAALR